MSGSNFNITDKKPVTSDADGSVDITSTGPDTSDVLQAQSTGTNPGVTRKFIGSRDPTGSVTAAGGDEYYRDDGVASGSYESLEATTGTGWFKRSLNPSSVIDIYSAAQLDALATGGVIAVTANITFQIKGSFTSATRFTVSTGVTLSIISVVANSPFTFTYSGTGPFVSGTGTVQLRFLRLTSSSTGSLVSLTTGNFQVVVATITGFDSLGTVSSGTLLELDSILFISTTAGIIATDMVITQVVSVAHVGVPLPGPFITVFNKRPGSLVTVRTLLLTTTAAGSAADISTDLSDASSVTFDDVTVSTGRLFKQTTVAEVPITAIAEASIANGTITAMATNGSGGTTISSTSVYFNGEQVTISGTTSYNGESRIFNVVAGVSFDIQVAFVANDATGTTLSERIALTVGSGHGITATDSIKVKDTNFYNDFNTVLIAGATLVTVNGNFVSTNAGNIERDVSIDQTDPRIRGNFNPGEPDSNSIAFGFSNNNTSGTTVTDGTYAAIDVSVFESNAVTQRFRLTNDTTAIYELTAIEDFQGFLRGALSAVKTGSTANYRFAMSINSAIPVFATANFVPMEVKTTKVSIPLLFVVDLTKGDTIQVMVAGDGTGDNLTLTDVVLGIG